jgi:class 3 adenylate cyclase
MDHKGSLIAIFATSILFASLTPIGAEEAKKAEVGYRIGSGVMLLRGPWERFEGSVAEDAMAVTASRTVELPLRAAAPGADSPGPATYRIVLRVEGASVRPSRLALYFPAFSGIEAAFVDGKKLFDGSRDPAAPPLLLFDAPGGNLSVVLRQSPSAVGLEGPSVFPPFVLFGDADSVDLERTLLGFGAAVCEGFFLLAGIFVFILFLFWKKNRDFLAFSVFLIAGGLLRSLEGAQLFLGLPILAGKPALELAHSVSVDLQYLALAFFVHTLYRDRIRPAAAAAIYAIPALLAAATLALPTWLGTIGLVAAACYCLLGLCALAFFVALAAKGDKRARWLIPAFLLPPTALILRSLGPEDPWNAYLAEPLAITAFSILVLLMLVKKVADSFESAEALSTYVDSVSRSVSSFIPKEFLQHLEKKDLIDLRLGDHAKKEMTIFFSDIRAFTQLSEGLTVEENFAFINSYLARVVPIIKENGGFVDKYIGDAIMALFPGPRGPDEAIRSAIAMQTKMVEYNGHRAKMGYKPISMGVGVHTGDLMLGVVGVIDRMENTVISDAVNLASRLQSITKAFNIGLAISEQSFKELEDPGYYKYRFIGKVKVKGKAAPVSVFEIFDGIAPDLFERKMKANMFFEQGMLSYYQKDFAGAMYYFKRTLEIIPEDGASGFYLDNCMNKASL